MATRSSDLDDQKSGVNVQIETTPSHHPVAEMALKRQRHLGAPFPFTIPVSGEETNTRPP